MSSIFSINGAGSMFFADSSNSTQNSASSIFGNTSSLLGDYAMIKSGGYKKLLTAYYASQKKDSTASGSSTSSASDSKSALLEVKTNSTKLKESLSKLSDSSLYEKKTDKDGNKDYDRDAITSAVKGFVEAYNNYVDSSSKVDSTGILRRSVSMVNNTSGVGSLGDTISSKAGESFGLANSAAFTMGHAATYTYSGAYSTFANSNNWFNGLM